MVFWETLDPATHLSIFADQANPIIEEYSLVAVASMEVLWSLCLYGSEMFWLHQGGLHNIREVVIM